MGLLDEQARRRVGEEVILPLMDAEAGRKKKRKQSVEGEQSVCGSIEGDRANIALLLFLYLLQGIPLGLASALPMILQKKGVLYKDQAMFSLVSWPFSLKLLWAPIVDSLFSEKFGRRKTWLIPAQYLIGISMLMLSYRVDHWLTDPAGPHTVLLTILFFMLNFLAATQDIAVDGWALTMLKRSNVGYASTCNSVGQTAGYFVGYVVFMALESASFCNSFLRSEPQAEGIVTLPSFLLWCGFGFVISTTLVGFFKHETSSRLDDESLNIFDSYKQLLLIIKLPAVRTIALIMLTIKVSFSACDAVTTLKLIDVGVPKEEFAMVAVFLMPLNVMLPILLSKYIAGQRPMDLYVGAYPYRLAFNFVAAAFVWLTPKLIEKDSIPLYYYILLVVVFSIHQLTVYSMFVAQMAFYAKISDPALGGTYMTLLNTVSNLGGSWPHTLILLFVDGLTFKQCSNSSDNTCSTTELISKCTGECQTWLDGYYLLILASSVYGLLWFSWGRRKIQALQVLDLNSWKVQKHQHR